MKCQTVIMLQEEGEYIIYGDFLGIFHLPTPRVFNQRRRVQSPDRGEAAGAEPASGTADPTPVESGIPAPPSPTA